MARFFLSYSTRDREVAVALHDRMTAEGQSVFLDFHLDDGIPPGSAWRRRIFAEMSSADAAIVLVSESYNLSLWCAAEFGAATVAGTKVVPVVIEEGVESRLLADHQAIYYATDPVDGWERLTRISCQIDTEADRRWLDGRNPYPGLSSFSSRDAAVFFGREAETTALVNDIRLLEGSVLLVAGASGSGKSSLVRAGLVPRFAADESWIVVPPFTPGAAGAEAADPVVELVLALARDVEASTEELGQRLRDADGLWRLLHERIAATSGAERALVVVDQFEELLTIEPDRLAPFVDLLRAAVGHRVVVIATSRNEYLTEIAQSEDLCRLHYRPFWVQPIAAEALPSVIAGPAKVAGLALEDGLVDVMVRDTDSGAALPLLAYTLQRMAEGLHRDDRLTLERYKAIGGVRGAIEQEAEEALGRATAVLPRDEVLDRLLNLVEIDEAGARTRRTLDRRTLDPATVAALGEFVKVRLLVESAGTLTVAHERFFDAWKPLEETIAARQSTLRTRTRLDHDAEEWQKGDRDRRRLWSPARVSLARSEGQLFEDGKLLSNAVSQEFFRASERRARWLRWRWFAVVGVVMVVVLAGGGAAVLFARAERAAREESDRQLTTNAVQNLLSQAEVSRGSDPALALRLDQAANALRPSDAAEAGIRATLVQSRLRATVVRPELDLSVGSWSPDKKLFIAARDDKVTLWRVGQPGAAGLAGSVETPEGFDLQDLVWSSDGAMVASEGNEGVRVFRIDAAHGVTQVGDVLDLHELIGAENDSATAAWVPGTHNLVMSSLVDARVVLFTTSATAVRRSTVLPVGREVAKLQWSPDGHTLAIGDYHGRVTFWRSGTGGRLAEVGGTLSLQDGAVRVLEWSPDGKAIAAAIEGNDMKVWNLTDLSRPGGGRRLSPGKNQSIESFAWSPDGTRLAATGDVGLLTWNAGNRRAVVPIPGPPATASASVEAVAWIDGRTLATVAGGSLRWWDLGNLSRRDTVPKSAGIAGGLAWSPTASVLATVDAGGVVRLLADGIHPIGAPLSTGVGIGPGASDLEGLPAVGWASDGTVLGVLNNFRVGFFDVSDTAHPKRIPWHYDHEVQWLVFAASGNVAALSSDAGTTIVEMHAGSAHAVHVVRAFGVESLTANARAAAVTTTSGHFLIDLSDPTAPAVKGVVDSRVADSNSTIGLSPSGDAAVVVGSGRIGGMSSGAITTTSVYLLDGGGGLTPVGQPLAGAGDQAAKVAWSPDGSLLWIGSASGSDSVWDLRDRALPHRVVESSSPQADTPAVAWSRDGRTVAVVRGDGPVTLLHLDGLGDLLANARAIACRAAGGELSGTEWDRYASGLKQHPHACS